MSQVYKKMYLTLFNRMEDVMDNINQKMVIPEAYDWDHTREILFQIQAALLEAEDTYMDAADD